MVLHGIEGYSPVHGSCIYVDIPDFTGQVFGHGALPAGRIAINGNDDFFHFYECLMILLPWMNPRTA
jgi:hypothetical protein